MDSYIENIDMPVVEVDIESSTTWSNTQPSEKEYSPTNPPFPFVQPLPNYLIQDRAISDNFQSEGVIGPFLGNTCTHKDVDYLGLSIRTFEAYAKGLANLQAISHEIELQFKAREQALCERESRIETAEASLKLEEDLETRRRLLEQRESRLSARLANFESATGTRVHQYLSRLGIWEKQVLRDVTITNPPPS